LIIVKKKVEVYFRQVIDYSKIIKMSCISYFV